MHRPITGRLVIATHNKGKLVEMRDLLKRYGVEAVSAEELNLPEPEETGRSFAANARLKAQAAAHASGLASFADDSGLVVDALDGAPGIYSARWAGPAKDFRHAMEKVEGIFSRRCASPGRTGRWRNSKAGWTARWYGRRAARKASATIRCSCRTALIVHSAR
jgi:XTP/dITP diphosphohydrolase